MRKTYIAFVFVRSCDSVVSLQGIACGGLEIRIHFVVRGGGLFFFLEHPRVLAAGFGGWNDERAGQNMRACKYQDEDAMEVKWGVGARAQLCEEKKSWRSV
jgi:hypothetical protein